MDENGATSDADADHETEAEAEPEADTESGPHSRTDPGAGIESRPGSTPNRRSRNPDPATDPESDPESESESDHTPDPDPDPADRPEPEPDREPGSGAGRRDVVVPLSLYKIVVVFSTLIAAASVVGGFMALDAATRRATAPPSQVDPVLAALGLGLIVAGAVVYAFASRFRAPGMGTPKNGADE